MLEWLGSSPCIVTRSAWRNVYPWLSGIQQNRRWPQASFQQNPKIKEQDSRHDEIALMWIWLRCLGRRDASSA